MLRIYLARHGQNEDNVRGTLNGHRDEPLTNLGIQQAKTTARFIADRDLDLQQIYTSPLSRAQTTAEMIATTLDMAAPTVVPTLIERDFGIMTGKPMEQIKELCAPDIIATETVTYFLSPHGAETFPELIIRGKQVISYVQNAHRDGAVLLVTHGDIGKMIYAAYYDLDWREVLVNFHFGNCEVLELAPDSPPEHVHAFSQEQQNY
jgi:probable phosphoglycerate mutase